MHEGTSIKIGIVKDNAVHLGKPGAIKVSVQLKITFKFFLLLTRKEGRTMGPILSKEIKDPLYSNLPESVYSVDLFFSLVVLERIACFFVVAMSGLKCIFEEIIR